MSPERAQSTRTTYILTVEGMRRTDAGTFAFEEQLTPIKQETISRIVTKQSKGFFDDPNKTFEYYYPSFTNYVKKYQLTKTLIEDGRYDNPSLLLQKFISPMDVDQETQAFAQELKDDLHLLAVEKGIIFLKPSGHKRDAQREEKKEAEASLSRVIDRDPTMKDILAFLPVYVSGALYAAKYFHNVSNEKKREELRSWVTNSVLRKYLGETTRYSTRRDINFHDLYQAVPEKLFTNFDNVTNQIVRNYFVSRAMRLFSEGEERGFEKLWGEIEKEQSEVKQSFLLDIYAQFENISKQQAPSQFVDKIEFPNETYEFPHLRQKYVVHEFLQTKRMLINGGTGSGKTATAYDAMETLHEETGEVERVTIFGPASARDTWPEQAKRIFRPEAYPEEMIFTVKGREDLDDPRIIDARYVYVGKELMATAGEDEALDEKLMQRLVIDRKTDAPIVDESHEFRNKNAAGTKMLVKLITAMQKQHVQRRKSEMPMMMLTATPIVNDLTDLDISLGLLYPDRFAVTKDDATNNKLTFSQHCLKNPNIAFTTLFGERLMMQWTREDLTGREAPFIIPEQRQVPLGPYQRLIYDWLHTLPDIGDLEKFTLYREVLLNPELIVRKLQAKGLTPKNNYTEDELVANLIELFTTWQSAQRDSIENDGIQAFNADWIATVGEPEFVLSCFFDESIQGVDGLVKRNKQKLPSELIEVWKMQDTPSAKFAFIRDFLSERYKHIVNGEDIREKVFIVVPEHKRGMTEWMGDDGVTIEDLQRNYFSLYELINLDWLPDLPNEATISIDGDMSFSKRRDTSERWRNEGQTFSIVVAHMDAVKMSMDFAIRDTEENKHVDKMTVLFTHWPWGWDDIEQMTGRFHRPGEAKPVDIMLLESPNTIDDGFYKHVRRKQLVIEMALHGIELEEDDKELLDSMKSKRKIILEEEYAGQMFVRDFMAGMKGVGEEEALERFRQQQRNGSFNSEVFGTNYFNERKDEFRTVGNNAEMVKNILLRSQPRKILSVGAGSCLLARKIAQSGYLPQEMVNFDLNIKLLEMVKEQFPEIGTVVEGRASDLREFDDEYFDALDSSFMIDWTKAIEDRNYKDEEIKGLERVKVLSEMNRVLKTGGTVSITLPESTFDDISFFAFTKSLITHFGFSVIADHTGKSFTKDITPQKRLGWVIVLQKEHSPDLTGLNPHDLTLLTDPLARIVGPKPDQEDQGKTVRITISNFAAKEFEIKNPFNITVQDVNGNSIDNHEGDLNEEYTIIENDNGYSNGEEKDGRETVIFTTQGYSAEDNVNQSLPLPEEGLDIHNVNNFESRNTLRDHVITRIETRWGVDTSEAENILVSLLTEHNVDMDHIQDFETIFGLIDSNTSIFPYATVDGLKTMLTQNQRKIWNIGLRRLQGMFSKQGINISYEDAEKLLTGILREKELDKIDKWNVSEVEKIIQSRGARIIRFQQRYQSTIERQV